MDQVWENFKLMNFAWEDQKRGIRLIVNGEHVKTVSRKLHPFLTSESIDKLDFSYKRISISERQQILHTAYYADWLANLLRSEKLVFELVKNSKPTAKRNVQTREGSRKELLFDNGVWIKIPDKLFHALYLDESSVCLNY
ncbi:hypothetical protein [Flavobacterium mesophilum]|uniref:hypothetical protein n=1 Tax=Flavobacterium mesophilum TaxID=3143495 RepID=UPI0031DEEF0B